MGGGLDSLLEAARGGSRQAFDRFVAETRPELAAFCARLVGRAEAEDAVQETYLGAWRALPAFRGESSARTWLFAIARRSSLKTLRRSARWSELARQTPRQALSPDPALGAELEDFLSRLELERRSALVLTQLLGFSYAEAALICDCPVGTIRSRVARAREALLQELRASAQEAG